MSDIEKIINDVDSSMRMEGLPLNDDDRERIKSCLLNPSIVNDVIKELLEKHRVPAEV
ncbi:MAG: hypothetical protein ACLUFN_00845 [Eubacterium sp.]